MLIYLLRHADAEDYAVNDAARVLSRKGLAQAAKVAAFCQLHLQPALILTSPVTRALATADSVLARLPGVPKIVDPRLACGMTPETGLDLIREYNRFPSILLVGHQPDLGDLTARLLSRDDSLHLDFGKAALLAIDLHMARPGAGVLQFFLPVKLLP